ncbi:ester cyclase [Mesorhizobium sp. YC-39]|uniref:ester cyclase n=1 Tax=unclassified Mesorhizobium TaxID=325217 RepID=UPI0021E8DC41|nr:MULTISPECIES: ester cyclase [unclassified Mesorhizobium]MCV3205596.1 ester cyclase [Mesorhizobium sp. YC-2]MCV3228005.1 ester cyclase [Mesorhizobium sp. YC-39]
MCRLPIWTAILTFYFAGSAPAETSSEGSSSLSLDQARAIVAPLYEALNEPAKKDVESLLTKTTSPDFRSCTGEDNCVDRDTAIAGFKALGEIVPDLQWAVRDILVAGDQIVVRGEATGTPAKPFVGVDPSGKAFKVMSIDIHSVEDGRVARTFHLEDWATGLRQLTAN